MSKSCHLCSFHRADPRFRKSAPTLLLPSLQLSPCRSTLQGFGTRGEEIESSGPPCRFMLQGFGPRDKRASLRVVSESADSTVQMHASGLWPYRGGHRGFRLRCHGLPTRVRGARRSTRCGEARLDECARLGLSGAVARGREACAGARAAARTVPLRGVRARGGGG